MSKIVFSFVGDFYHSQEHITNCIKSATILATGSENLIDNSMSPTHVLEAVKKNPSLIIIGGENRINPKDEDVLTWLTTEVDDMLEEYVLNGGSLMVIHSGLASYPKDSKYRRMTKGHFVAHPPEHVMVRYYTAEDAEITCDFTLRDEFYELVVDTEETEVFMYSHSEEFGDGFGAWRHNYGSGKVVCIAPTHNTDGLADERTHKLFADCIKWAHD